MGDSLSSEDMNRDKIDDDDNIDENERGEETAGAQKREYLANLLMSL